jgi:hypothetical protein
MLLVLCRLLDQWDCTFRLLYKAVFGISHLPKVYPEPSWT